MKARLGSAPQAPAGWRGVLGAWLQAVSREFQPVADPPPLEAGAARVRRRLPVRVLVVDDNPVNLAMLASQLEQRGISPLQAADGAEAVALACELPFDLILMDLQMPILDGLGATAAIRRFEGSIARPAVPVIAYSSLSPGAGVLSAHGLNGSLSKPCTDEELDDCLARWCRPWHAAAVAPAGAGAARDGGRLPARLPAGPAGASMR
ncbi:response regulator [Rubrivivax sp. RP6-9]|uniref:response regulator n=1 Tax=Rubrivivax sp. RP6-9 TaxID=3415750 RepID=UPI003CC61082